MLETDDSGKCWDAKIKTRNGDLYMTDGWPEFVKENGITEPDFLTFRLLMLPRLFAFKVSIYRADGCIKHSGDGDVEILHENVIKSVNGGSLPAAFWKVGGMRGRRDVTMEYVATGDCKSVVLDHRSHRTDLARGWPEFRKANGIIVGKTYSFEFNPNRNVIRVKELVKY
ncbi:hypothetical protein C2S53_011562 [Perilla frutescens var. hirtella]|uniref:TF-B3 domain-containing protein n=1 Tax=Perilla frutescens var. hirtella TaxID=608512 RepID=A0AAD4JA39_PERFH|nr:hypothetical protein C2S53_011562 [Perilla frutescens var. hirtella]